MTTIYFCYIDSPIGRLYVRGDGMFVTALYMSNHKGWSGPNPSEIEAASSFTVLRTQLDEYFAGERQVFDVPFKLDGGSEFQQRVWRELTTIPYGTTITYGELARRVGSPAGSRAVGNANGKNPISILVPCHRVIGTNGKLTGYGGGLHRKQSLLELERGYSRSSPRDLFDAAGLMRAERPPGTQVPAGVDA